MNKAGDKDTSGIQIRIALRRQFLVWGVFAHPSGLRQVLAFYAVERWEWEWGKPYLRLYPSVLASSLLQSEPCEVLS